MQATVEQRLMSRYSLFNCFQRTVLFDGPVLICNGPWRAATLHGSMFTILEGL